MWKLIDYIKEFKNNESYDFRKVQSIIQKAFVHSKFDLSLSPTQKNEAVSIAIVLLTN